MPAKGALSSHCARARAATPPPPTHTPHNTPQDYLQSALSRGPPDCVTLAQLDFSFRPGTSVAAMTHAILALRCPPAPLPWTLGGSMRARGGVEGGAVLDRHHVRRGRGEIEEA